MRIMAEPAKTIGCCNYPKKVTLHPLSYMYIYVATP